VKDNQEANELRKQGAIDSAIPIYKEQWEKSHDKFAAAGLLYCYRKKKDFSKAFPLADEVYSKFPDFDWCRNEYIWTLIQGKLYSFPDDGETNELLEIVNKILEANPDEIALKVTVFKLLKNAKKHKIWVLLNEWISKIDPEILSGYTDESTGWTDKELWYYYKVNGLLFLQKEDEAISIIDNEFENFFKQRKFFLRLKAKALLNLNKIDEAESVYKILTSASKVDWWLYHEYGKLLLEKNNIEYAFLNLLKAALSPPMKLELKVSLFSDIGDLLIKKEQKENALIHYQLARVIREEQGWGLNDLIIKIEDIHGEDDKTDNKISLFEKCKTIWQSQLNTALSQNKIKTKNLNGELVSLKEEKPFCFIKTKNGQSYFCSKDDLPTGALNRQKVQFDLKPSFDKKKNKKTFRAINIKMVNE
jgi:hypothetical protein